MNIYDLENRNGNAAELLGIEREGEIVDLSPLDWERPLIVLRGLMFDHVLLKGVKIRPNLVECRITDSIFADLESRSHFWGAGNVWAHCQFSRVRMQDVIAPQCRFDECTFDDVTLSAFRLCETIFSNCTFNRISFSGMRAKERSYLLSAPELDKLGASGGFLRCSFRKPTFENCYFRGVAFNQCSVLEPQISNCDFSGIISDEPWWNHATSCDPFAAFLDEILQLVEKQLGAESSAFVAMKKYIDDYTSGQTNSKDYTACLFDGSVPYADLQKIEKGLEAIELQYSV
jgi:uncharacterized protein YjbI with pentapeptide repeats